MASLPPGAQYFDTNGVFTDMYTHPAEYGLANVTDLCPDHGGSLLRPEQLSLL